MGGVHPADNKISRDAAIENFPVPEVAYISMSQHLGAPAEPVVAVGDKVKVGQLIANASGFISAPVHSSVSGTVKSIETVKDIAGNPCKAVVITVEGDEWVETIDHSEDIVREIKLDSKQIIEKIKECGVVGLGGATFPTCVKLSPPPALVDNQLSNHSCKRGSRISLQGCPSQSPKSNSRSRSSTNGEG